MHCKTTKLQNFCIIRIVYGEFFWTLHVSYSNCESLVQALMYLTSVFCGKTFNTYVRFFYFVNKMCKNLITDEMVAMRLDYWPFCNSANKRTHANLIFSRYSWSLPFSIGRRIQISLFLEAKWKNCPILFLKWKINFWGSYLYCLFIEFLFNITCMINWNYFAYL